MLGAKREIDILSLSNVMSRQDIGYELGDILKRTGEKVKRLYHGKEMIHFLTVAPVVVALVFWSLELNGDQLPNGASSENG